MGNEPAHIVDEGKEIALFELARDNHLWPMEAVGLPEIIGKFRFKSPPVQEAPTLSEPRNA